MSDRSLRFRLWPLLVLALAGLLVVPPNAAETAVRPVAVQGWLSEGLDGGGSDGGGSDGGDSGGDTEVASGPDSGSDDSGGDSGGGVPEVESGPSDKSSDDSSGGDSKVPDVEAGPDNRSSDDAAGESTEVASGPDSRTSDSSSGNGADEAIPEMVSTRGSTSDGTAGENDTSIPELLSTEASDGAANRGGTDQTTPAAIVDGQPVPAQDDQPASGNGQPAVDGTARTAVGAPGESADPSAVTAPRPATDPGQPTVAGPVPTAPGQGTDPAAGQAYYQNLLKSDGPAASGLRTLDPAQIDQLAEAGPPRNAEQVVDLVTGIRQAAPGTVEEYDRKMALRQWFKGSRERPADFEAFASSLPPEERAKLEQQFEENKPGDITQEGGISYYGRKASDFLRDMNEQAARENPSNFIPGSWPDRIEKSGNKFIEGIPEGLATSFEHLLLEDPTAQLTNGDDPYYQRLIGESDEHYEQRLHPFSQDLKAMGQAYADDVKPIFTDGDWSKLGQRFYDDPVGAGAMYAPVGAGAGKLLSRTGGPLVRSAANRLRGSPKPGPGKAEPGAPEGAALTAGTPEGAAPQSGAAAASAEGGSTPESGAATTAGAAEAAETARATAPAGNITPQVHNPDAPADAGVARPPARASPGPAQSTAAPTTAPESNGPYAGAPTMVEPGAGAASGDRAIEALKSGDNAKLAEELAPKPVAFPPSRGLSNQIEGRQAGAAGSATPGTISANPTTYSPGDLERVAKHLSQFGPHEPNDLMIGRIQEALKKRSAVGRETGELHATRTTRGRTNEQGNVL